MNKSKSFCVKELNSLVDSWFDKWNDKIIHSSFGLEDAKEELKIELAKWVGK